MRHYLYRYEPNTFYHAQSG